MRRGFVLKNNFARWLFASEGLLNQAVELARAFEIAAPAPADAQGSLTAVDFLNADCDFQVVLVVGDDGGVEFLFGGGDSHFNQAELLDGVVGSLGHDWSGRVEQPAEFAEVERADVFARAVESDVLTTGGKCKARGNKRGDEEMFERSHK